MPARRSRAPVVSTRLAVSRILLMLFMAASCGTASEVTIRASGRESSPGSTKQCAGAGGAYIVHYPASWFTIDHGPVPCRYFDPEPFALPESTEATELAINVQFAPAPFDQMVPGAPAAEGFEETLSRRSGDVSGHRSLRIESLTRGPGILPAGTRRLTWYLEAQGGTLVATTSADGFDGSFASHANVLDEIVAGMELRPDGGAVSEVRQDARRALVSA